MQPKSSLVSYGAEPPFVPSPAHHEAERDTCAGEVLTGAPSGRSTFPRVSGCWWALRRDAVGEVERPVLCNGEAELMQFLDAPLVSRCRVGEVSTDITGGIRRIMFAVEKSTTS